MEHALALLALPLAYLAAFGWGAALERLVYGDSLGRSAYSVALGLLAWLGIGGLLNHLALATPPALDVLLGAGVLLAAAEWRRRGGRLARPAIGIESLPTAVAVATGAWFAFGLLPASAFNFHDDFYKYLPRLAGMLQTGSVGGDPFDLVGIDSLGMQTFLQGVFVAHLPITYANAFDAVFCLVLAALLVDALGRELNVGWALRTLAVIALLVLNPQYVNVSALYSGMVMIVAMSFATLLFARTLDAPASGHAARSAVPIGLFAAAVAGLKVTLIPYAAGYLLVLLLLAVTLKGSRAKVLAGAAGALGAGLLLYSLWAALSAQKLLKLLALASERTGSGVTQLAATASDRDAGYLAEVLAKDELFYGGHLYQYLSLLGMIALLGLVAAVMLYRRPSSRAVLLAAAASGIGCLVSALGILIGVYGIHVDALVRYNTPMLIAGLPSAALLLYGAFATEHTGGESRRIRPVTSAAIALLLAAPVVMQGSLWLERAGLAAGHHHMLAFPVSATAEQRLEAALSPAAGEEVRGLQDRIPAGATLLSWSGMAYHFDYRRNRVFTLASPTLFRAMADTPARYRATWLRRFLREAGVDYVLWAYRGRRPSWGKEYKLLLDGALGELANKSPVIYADRNLVLFSVKPGGER